jgi:hypothetical protein
MPARADPSHGEGAAGALMLAHHASASKTRVTSAAVARAPGRDISTPAISTGKTSKAPWFRLEPDSWLSKNRKAIRSTPTVNASHTRGPRLTGRIWPRPHSQAAAARASTAYRLLIRSAAVFGVLPLAAASSCMAASSTPTTARAAR